MTEGLVRSCRCSSISSPNLSPHLEPCKPHTKRNIESPNHKNSVKPRTPKYPYSATGPLYPAPTQNAECNNTTFSNTACTYSINHIHIWTCDLQHIVPTIPYTSTHKHMRCYVKDGVCTKAIIHKAQKT